MNLLAQNSVSWPQGRKTTSENCVKITHARLSTTYTMASQLIRNVDHCVRSFMLTAYNVILNGRPSRIRGAVVWFDRQQLSNFIP